jgi:hypothetical protein
MAVSRFPTDSRYASLYSGDIPGPIVINFQQLTDQYPGIVVKQMMVGATRGGDSTARIRTWVLHLQGLTRVQAKQHDDHFAEAKEQLLGFQFRQWRTGMDDSGTLYSGVHYLSYEKPGHVHIDIQERIITLVKEGLA